VKSFKVSFVGFLVELFSVLRGFRERLCNCYDRSGRVALLVIVLALLVQLQDYFVWLSCLVFIFKVAHYPIFMPAAGAARAIAKPENRRDAVSSRFPLSLVASSTSDRELVPGLHRRAPAITHWPGGAFRRSSSALFTSGAVLLKAGARLFQWRRIHATALSWLPTDL
jgi:hypothetical protein